MGRRKRERDERSHARRMQRFRLWQSVIRAEDTCFKPALAVLGSPMEFARGQTNGQGGSQGGRGLFYRDCGCPSKRDVNAIGWMDGWSARQSRLSLCGRLRSWSDEGKPGNPIDEWVFQREGSVRSVGNPFRGRKGTIGPVRIACQIIWSAGRRTRRSPAGRGRVWVMPLAAATNLLWRQITFRFYGAPSRSPPPSLTNTLPEPLFFIDINRISRSAALLQI